MQLKREEVTIGEKEFHVKELTCLNRDALLDIIGSYTFADILKSVMPILDELGITFKKEKGEEEDSIGQLIKFGLQNETLWGGLMACLINALHVGPQIIVLSLDEQGEETQTYVLENLTITQEPVILQKIIEINKLPDTVKNYKALMTNVKELMATAKN